MGFAIVHSLCLVYPLQVGLQKGCYPTGELKEKRKLMGELRKKRGNRRKFGLLLCAC